MRGPPDDSKDHAKAQTSDAEAETLTEDERAWLAEKCAAIGC